jgi:hypothetical protein
MKRAKPAVAPRLAQLRLVEGLRELGLGRINRDGFRRIMNENNLSDRDIDAFLCRHDPAADRWREIRKAFSK